MGLLLKTFVFIGPVVLAWLMRIVIIVVRKGPELDDYDKHTARYFDVSLDLLLGSMAILLGLLLYSRSNTLKKPGTNISITGTDIVICSVVQFFALILILFLSLAMPHFAPQQEDMMTVWLPDLCGAVALLWSMVKLA
jgi:hypothetical protein